MRFPRLKSREPWDQSVINGLTFLNWGSDAVTIERLPARRGVTFATIAGVILFGGWLLLPITRWNQLGRENITITAIYFAIAIPVLIALEIISWAQRIKAQPLLGMAPPYNAYDAAQRSLLRGMRDSWRSRWFDTAGFFQDLGKHRAPRIVFVGCLAACPSFDDVFEEIDLCSQRAISKKTVRGVRRQIAWLAAWALVLYFLVWSKMPVMQMLQSPLLLGYVVYSAWFLTHIGWAPFHLTSAVASIGRLSMAGLFAPPGEFNRDNSVLVVIRHRRMLKVRLCRLDAKVATLSFRGGADDPGLAQLLSRWHYAAESGEAARAKAKSASSVATLASRST